MKILQVTPRYYPFFGGVEEVVRQYSQRLVSNFDDDVAVLTSGNVDNNEVEKISGVTVYRLENIPDFVTDIRKLGSFYKAGKSIEQNLKTMNYDLAHLHANKRFTTDVASIFLSIQKKSFVFSPHAGQFGTSITGKIHNYTLGKVAFSAKKIIVVSNYEKRLIAKFGFNRNVEVFPNGIDHKEFEKVKSNYLSSYDPKGKVKILFVGRLATSKGADLLPLIAEKVIRDIPEALFVMVGNDDGYGENLKFKIKNLKMEKHFLLLEKLNREDLISVYKNSDLFVLPTRSEAFGVVLLEAMAAGLPIVASNNTAVPELIKDSETGLLAETENTDDFSSKLIKLIKDKQLAKSLGDVAQKKSQDYDWDKIVSRLRELYQGVLR